MLNVFGYRIYDCKLVEAYNQNIERKIISKRNLKLCQGESIYAKGLNNDYSLDCGKNTDD